MIKLLAVDPGKTVGFAWFNYNVEEQEVDLIKAEQLHWKEFLDYLYNEIKNDSNFDLMYESYRIRTTTISANLNKELLTVKIIGVIEWMCRQYDIEFESQPAGIGNQFFDKKRLKNLEMWTVGKVHARDATRHGLYYLTFGKGKVEKDG